MITNKTTPSLVNKSVESVNEAWSQQDSSNACEQAFDMNGGNKDLEPSKHDDGNIVHIWQNN